MLALHLPFHRSIIGLSHLCIVPDSVRFIIIIIRWYQIKYIIHTVLGAVWWCRTTLVNCLCIHTPTHTLDDAVTAPKQMFVHVEIECWWMRSAFYTLWSITCNSSGKKIRAFYLIASIEWQWVHILALNQLKCARLPVNVYIVCCSGSVSSCSIQNNRQHIVHRHVIHAMYSQKYLRNPIEWRSLMVWKRLKTDFSALRDWAFMLPILPLSHATWGVCVCVRCVNTDSTNRCAANFLVLWWCEPNVQHSKLNSTFPCIGTAVCDIVFNASLPCLMIDTNRISDMERHNRIFRKCLDAMFKFKCWNSNNSNDIQKRTARQTETVRAKTILYSNKRQCDLLFYLRCCREPN